MDGGNGEGEVTLFARKRWVGWNGNICVRLLCEQLMAVAITIPHFRNTVSNNTLELFHRNLGRVLSNYNQRLVRFNIGIDNTTFGRVVYRVLFVTISSPPNVTHILAISQM